MPEHVIGVNPRDVIHQRITAEGSLTFAYNKRDIVANTIGHILAVPTTHTILWTWGSAFRNPSKELVTELYDRYKDVPWKGDVLVRVGHSSIFGDIQRMLASNERVRGRPWNIKDKVGRTLEYAGKLGAAILMVPSMIKNKFLRADYYNPFSNTVNIYHPKLAPGMHELGHAEFFNQMENKKRAAYYIGIVNPIVTIPFFRSFYEWQASAIALKRFKGDAERRAGLKILEGAWATYLAIDSLTTAALVAPALAIPLLKAAWSIPFVMPLGQGTVLKGIVSLGMAPYGASIGGHMMNRLYPKKDQRFGYIFSGGTAPGATRQEMPVQFHKKRAAAPQHELSAHQVLTATAKAPVKNTRADDILNRQFTASGDQNGKRPLHSNTHRVTF